MSWKMKLPVPGSMYACAGAAQTTAHASMAIKTSGNLLIGNQPVNFILVSDTTSYTQITIDGAKLGRGRRKSAVTGAFEAGVNAKYRVRRLKVLSLFAFGVHCGLSN
jgi:hypothetical protein